MVLTAPQAFSIAALKALNAPVSENELMKLFTVVTVVFLPLTLLTGWYGMNFTNIPELTWRYGYPAAIGASVLIVVLLLRHFRKKRWL